MPIRDRSNTSFWEYISNDTGTWINSDRSYPHGPIACGECVLNEDNKADGLSQECIHEYGPDGCSPIAPSFGSGLWVFLYLVWITTLCFFIFWSVNVRANRREKITKVKRRTSTFTEFVASGELDNVISNTFKTPGGLASAAASPNTSFDLPNKIRNDYGNGNNFNSHAPATTAGASATVSSTAENSNADGNNNNYINSSDTNSSVDSVDGESDHKHTLTMDAADRMTVTCYRETQYETIGMGLITFNSTLLILYLFIVLIDYYYGCEIKNIDNFCFYGNYVFFGDFEGNSNAMFFTWCVSVVWFLIIISGYDAIRNWLRLPSSPANATHVRVWVEDAYEELSAKPTRLMKIGRSLENWFERKILGKKRPGHSQTVPVKTCELPASQGMRYFEFECARYTLPTSISNYAPNRIRAVALGGSPTLGTVLKHSLKDRSKGLTAKESAEVRDVVGANEIAFTVPSYSEAAREEFFTVFYLYQFASYAVWVWFAYWFVGVWLILIVLMSAATNIYMRIHNLRKVMSLTIHHDHVNVKRNGAWVSLMARELVPGDIVQVMSEPGPSGGNGWKVPADLILVQGSCATDESGLTGESMPVAKSAIDKRDSDVVFDFLDKKCVKHVLFAGTIVLETSAPEDGGDIIAMVMATGIDTSRGELISTILYPAPMRFQYDEEFPIALLFLVIYGIFAFLLSIYFMESAGQNSSIITRWTYSMYTISEIITPMLKISLSVGQINASQRLAKQSVLCVNPPRIAISGKLRIFCFDKTGTLTKEGLDFVGVRGIDTTDKKLFPVMQRNLPINTEQALACCHAVTCFRGRYLGNAVEVSMFQAVGWSLSPDNQTAIAPNQNDTLKIVRRFEFDHSRMTMSVIVNSSTEPGKLISFCKGAPEKIASICDPKTVPNDYLAAANAHAMDGCYVIGLARSKRELDVSIIKKSIQSTTGTVEDFDRDEIESNLECIGLLLFRNELKDDTAAAIDELKKGAVRPVMVTGDNAACGQYIARASGMTPASTAVLLGEFDPEQVAVIWRSMNVDTESIGSSKNSKQSYRTFDRIMTTHEVLDLMERDPFAADLAVTGKAFDILNETHIIRQLLPFMRIYARMSPHNKIRVVKLYMEEGLVVGMCGDGGNDVGALRSAHVGLALSEAEASVVAPFTSGTKSVQSAADLLREGRASLANSFAGYKFLVQYGLLFSVAELMSYRSGVMMSIAQYLTMDLLAVVTLGYSMTLCEPKPVLGREQPTASLLGLHTVSSVIGTFIISLIVLGFNFSIIGRDKNYVPWPSRLSEGADWWMNGDAWEVTTIFFSIFMCFVSAACAFSFGGPYRKNICYNYILIFWIVFFYIVGVVLMLTGPNDLTRAYHIASEAFNTYNTTSYVWMLYQQHGGAPSPGMDMQVRAGMWVCTFIFGVLGISLWEKVFVHGSLGRKVAKMLDAEEVDEAEALKWTGLSIRDGYDYNSDRIDFGNSIFDGVGRNNRSKSSERIL